jgi:hypothetical protein
VVHLRHRRQFRSVPNWQRQQLGSHVAGKAVQCRPALRFAVKDREGAGDADRAAVTHEEPRA